MVPVNFPKVPRLDWNFRRQARIPIIRKAEVAVEEVEHGGRGGGGVSYWLMVIS